MAVFGAGSGGRRALAMLQARGARVVCVADNDQARHGQALEGVPIVAPASLPARAIDLVVVASAPGRGEILTQLVEMGYRDGRDIVVFSQEAA